MGIFDKVKDVAEKAKEGAEDLLEKGTIAAKKEKYKFDISQVKGKIKDIYAQIGEKIFEMRNKNVLNVNMEAKIWQDMFADIDKLNAEIKEIEKKIEDLDKEEKKEKEEGKK